MSLRSRLSLDGAWLFWQDPSERLEPGTLSGESARKVMVPAPWQSQGQGLERDTGTGWYQRDVDVPAEWLAQRVVIGFSAVDDVAEVWLNGVRVGGHEGGYLPFELDVTDAARAGANTLTVRVADPVERWPEIPHGKQSWYGPLSGLWQSVWIERRAAVHIQNVKVTAHLADGGVDVTVTLNRPLAAAQTLVLEVRDPDGAVCASTEGSELNARLTVASPRAWDVESPNLYTLRAELIEGQGESRRIRDAQTVSFGFRTIETRDGRLWLNGRPLYLRAALDQDYYPGLISTPPSVEYLEDQFRKAKAMGLNCLRIHIKVGDPRYYAAADRVGLLIWTELPNWSLLTDLTRQRARTTLRGMVERDWHHPSIIIWTIINESWGVDLTNPEHRAWLAETYDELKALDPQRLVVDNSACWGNFHVVSDLEDYHNYYAIPDHFAEWRDWVANFASRGRWTYAHPYTSILEWREYNSVPWNWSGLELAPEVRRRGDEPLIVSEFGNWGLPDVEALIAGYGGQEPWWFETGQEWGDGVVYPHAVQQRFSDFHFDRAFPTLSALAKASQHMQHVALKYEIEQMRLHSSIQGYVITEFTDVHWECNGLLNMHREPKAFIEALPTIQADDVVVPNPERVVFWPGERCTIPVVVSHYSSLDLAQARLTWALEGSPDLKGELRIEAAPAPTVVDAGSIAFEAPAVDVPTRARVTLDLLNREGQPVASNEQTLYFFPRVTWSKALRLYAPELEPALERLGCTLVPDLQQADLAVVNTLSDDLRLHLLGGGRVLWLAESPDFLRTNLPGIGVRQRRGQSWQGDWASSFSWLFRDRLFADIPTDGLLDFAFADLTPDCVLTGFAPHEFATLVHAGLTVGWLHKTVALVGERYLGRGRLLASTLRLSQQLLDHPVAAWVFADLMRYAARQ